MGIVNIVLSHYGFEEDGPLAKFIGVIMLATIAVGLWRLSTRMFPKRPKALGERLPFITNTIEFLNDNERFMKKLMRIFEHHSIAMFYLGGQRVYALGGPHNVQTIFGRNNKVGSEDIFVQNVLPRLYRLPKNDVKKFENDKSGRGKIPAHGSEGMPADQRYWAAYEHVHTEYLARTQHLKPIMEAYQSQFSTVLNKYPVGKWSQPQSLIEFCRKEVTECAMSTLLGPKVFELNPGFREAFWEFDNNIFMLTLGFPRWLYSKPYKVQDRYLAMIEKYVAAARAAFDWDGPDAEAFWEPHFGARVCRETVKWFDRSGFPNEAVAGALGTLLFAQNSNTIPTTIWCMIEIFKDPLLFNAMKEEVLSVSTIDPTTGERTLETTKVVMLPLLQSVFTEVLRLHMNFNIIRHTKEPFVVDGYTLEKGSMVQLPMMPAHFDESVWGSEGHPATGFWAERHIKYTEDTDASGKLFKKKTFAMAGRPSSFFPFGGGPPVCPGRHFAKHEILTSLALLLLKFDVELVEWTTLDGKPSDRAARDDRRYCGVGAAPPDRDMKFRLRRLH